MAFALVSSPEAIRRRAKELLQETRADEIIATAQIFDHPARLRLVEIFAQVMESLD